MKNFDTRVYSISDIVEWNSNGLLDLSPRFQRRSVWSQQAKSYLIDTILSGKPMPKVLITQEVANGRNKRTVVDGQQRVRAILEFCENSFSVSKVHNKTFGGCKFHELPDDAQNDFLQYELGVDVLFNVSYEETLDIFARLNTYSVRLNPQELFNAKYLGPFKQFSYELGYAYVRYWEEASVLSPSSVSRMAEAALASDLLAATLGGITAKKQIKRFYDEFDGDAMMGDVEKAAGRVRDAVDTIMLIYKPSDLKSTNFNRSHIFYSLFCAVSYHLGGLPKIEAERRPDFMKNAGAVRVALDDFSAQYDEADERLAKFINASQRATTDADQRLYRAVTLAKVLGDAN